MRQTRNLFWGDSTGVRIPPSPLIHLVSGASYLLIWLIQLSKSRVIAGDEWGMGDLADRIKEAHPHHVLDANKIRVTVKVYKKAVRV